MDVEETFGQRLIRAVPVILYALGVLVAVSMTLFTKKAKGLPMIYALLILTAFLVPLLWVCEADPKPRICLAVIGSVMGLSVAGIFINAAIRASRDPAVFLEEQHRKNSCQKKQ